jgi:hypothetical protein
MYNIVIPVIMVFIYLIYLQKNKIKESFQSTNVTLLNSNKKDDKRYKPKFTINLVELNPMLSERKFVIRDELNDDGTIKKGVLTNVENTEWKEDFRRKLCMGCSCFSPKIYWGKDSPSETAPNFTESPAPAPAPNFTESPAPAPAPNFTESPAPAPAIKESFSNMSPSPSDKTIDYQKIVSSYKTDYEENLVMEKRKNCGFRMDGNEYQCAQVCPQCNLCHKDESNIQTKYLDKCNLPMEAEDEELCKFYRDRVKFIKESCIFPSKLKNVIVNDRECFSFHNRNNNRYFTNDKIIFKLKSDKNVDLIDLYQMFYRNNKNKKINITPISFFSNQNEFYFYINTKSLPQFIGNVKLFFVLNITYLGEKERYDYDMTINVRKPLEYIKMYENVPIKKKNDIRKDDTLPVDFDLYNLNYLEESELNPKQIVSGYSARNKVEDYEIGEFKRLEYKDNPETWKLRPDINRPWISVG